MMKAIIFGVTGQDGSHLADLLLSKNYEVIGVARRSSVDTTERIAHLADSDGFELVQGDITDVSSIINILSNNNDVDEVYNLAAQSHVGVSFKQPGLTWDITGKGVLNILQSIVDLGLHCRFYQASSSEMFGDSYDVNPNDGIKYQNEDTKFLPQSPYAIAKCAAHYAVRLYREAYGLHASAGILFNHEGERRGVNFVTRKITKWIGSFMGWCESKKIEPSNLVYDVESIYIPGRTNEDQEFQFPKLRLGNLEACRDWGYAGDYVEAMWIMLQQEDPDDYVICTEKTYSIKQFLERAFKYAGIENWEDHVFIDPEFYRPADVEYLKGSSKKARTKLGWTPKSDLEDLVNIMMKNDLNENIQSFS
tara:strand:- start:7512 stop:8603 length:1092 start_codon:yes stop_codon:yes gene_type:complete